MNGLIRASLRNPIAVTVRTLRLALLGRPWPRTPSRSTSCRSFRSPAVQVLTFYGGMPARSIEKNITSRMERGVGPGVGRRGGWSRARSSAPASCATTSAATLDRSGALTECASLAGWEYPTMPPGTLPPVILPVRPESSTPVCLMALDSQAGGRMAGDGMRGAVVRHGAVRGSAR